MYKIPNLDIFTFFHWSGIICSNKVCLGDFENSSVAVLFKFKTNISVFFKIKYFQSWNILVDQSIYQLCYQFTYFVIENESGLIFKSQRCRNLHSLSDQSNIGLLCCLQLKTLIKSLTFLLNLVRLLMICC